MFFLVFGLFLSSDITLIHRGCFELTFSLRVLLAEFLDDLALLLNLFLQTVILALLIHHLYLSFLPLLDKDLLADTLFFQL